MKTKLIAFAIWLLARLDQQVIFVDSYLVASARKICADVEQRFPDASGEHKRHQALALLMKQHRVAGEGELARAIEVACL